MRRRDPAIDVFVRMSSNGLVGDLTIPEQAAGIVVFAHGSGSSRLSPRNRFVAEQLQKAGLATLLFDLLTPDEELRDSARGHLSFDIEFLAGRLWQATTWLADRPETQDLQPAYFGASTGGAAAIVAAAAHPAEVFSVVSRGGRPDLAAGALDRLTTPTLLLVGARDEPVIDLNRLALDRIRSAEKRLDIIPEATHLFQEPGTLEQVAVLARDWFVHHLPESANRPAVGHRDGTGSDLGAPGRTHL